MGLWDKLKGKFEQVVAAESAPAMIPPAEKTAATTEFLEWLKSPGPAEGSAELYRDRIQHFIDFGADVNGKDEEGNSPLIHAVSKGFANFLIGMLLKAGAKPDDANAKGWTALMYASATGQVEVVEALLARNADPGLVNSDGNTAFKVATSGEIENKIMAAVTQRAEAAAAVNRIGGEQMVLAQPVVAMRPLRFSLNSAKSR